MALQIVGAERAAKKTVAKKTVAKKVAPSRRGWDDDGDDDDEPRRPRKAAAAAPGRAERRSRSDDGEGATRGNSKAGWAESDRVFAGGDYANTLTLKDGEEVVIRFLEDQPYTSLRIHWLDRKGKRSYPCPGDPKKPVEANGCPFCEYAISYRSEARFNVAVLTEAEPGVWSLTATPRNRKKIKAHHESKHGPLTRKFYYFRRNGTGFDTEYAYDYVRTPAEIAEDFPDLYIPTEDELAALTRFTTEQANREFATLAEMRKVAREVVSGEDEDD